MERAYIFRCSQKHPCDEGFVHHQGDQAAEELCERGRCIAGLGGYQMFDSLAVEAGGNICVATLISGCISVISPDGRLVEQVPVGDVATTNIAFGGPELRTAYITLSGRGELIRMDWPRPGLPLNFLNK